MLNTVMPQLKENYQHDCSQFYKTAAISRNTTIAKNLGLPTFLMKIECTV